MRLQYRGNDGQFFYTGLSVTYVCHLLGEHDGDGGWGNGLPWWLLGGGMLNEVGYILVLLVWCHLLIKICVAVGRRGVIAKRRP